MTDHSRRDDPLIDPARMQNLRALTTLSDRFGASIAGAFARGAADGRRFDQTLKSLHRSLIDVGTRAALAPLQGLLSRLLGSLFDGASGPDGALSALVRPKPFAKGGVIARGGVTPFADGGIVASPTYFPLGRGMGVMGERGPEAIMPLARGPDGRLGVRAAAERAPPIVVNIVASDVESFRRSEAQVAAGLARAVARGRRAT